MATTPSQDLYWKQYELHVDLYKFYMDFTIKVNAFHYAITGAILSFYFTHSEIGMAKWSLVLPLGLSLGLAGLFWYGAGLVKTTREELFSIRDKLGVEPAPEISVLAVFMRLMAATQTLTGIGILLLLIFR